MKTLSSILICLGTVFGPATDRAMAAAPRSEGDSLRSEAIALVERTLGMLQNSRDLNPFKSQFSSSAAQHPCDFCNEVVGLPVESYAFQVLENYPETFDFRYRVDHGHVKVERDDLGIPFRVNVPYSKRIRLPKGGDGLGDRKTRVVHLVAKVRVGPEGAYSMETIVQELAPGDPMTFVEGSVGVVLGRIAYSDTTKLDPKNTGMRGALGVIRYFNPFSSLNRSNIWLKTGIRAVWSATSLVQQEITYLHDDVALTPAQTPNTPLDQRIDLAWHVHELEERVKTLSMEVPLGMSKRWQIGTRSVFALDIGATVGYELFKDITGRYRMDQHGSDHRIDGQLMGQSNGSPLVYMDPNAAVVSDQGGERIDFFSDRQYVLDDLEQHKKGTFSFGVTPSLLIGGKREGSFRIGLDLSMVKRRSTSMGALNETYFLSGSDNSRAALSEMGKGGFRPWLGLVLAIQL